MLSSIHRCSRTTSSQKGTAWRQKRQTAQDNHAGIKRLVILGLMLIAVYTLPPSIAFSGALTCTRMPFLWGTTTSCPNHHHPTFISTKTTATNRVALLATGDDEVWSDMEFPDGPDDDDLLQEEDQDVEADEEEDEEEDEDEEEEDFDDEDIVAQDEDDDDVDDDELELDPFDDDMEIEEESDLIVADGQDMLDEEIYQESAEDGSEDDEVDDDFGYSSLEGDFEAIPWDHDVDGGDYPLEDDPDDPNYQRQKELLEMAVQQSEQKKSDDDFNAMDYIVNKMTPEEASIFDQSQIIQNIEERTKDLVLTEEDIADIDLEAEFDKVTDLMDDDPYIPHQPRKESEPQTPANTNLLEADIGITDEDLQRLDEAWKTIRNVEKVKPWDEVMNKDLRGDWNNLSNETLAEMEACLDEIGGSSYNVSKWLLYDLDFDVANLMLAAVKHNRDAPVIFQHWYPQLLTYSRYSHWRDRGFNFNWEDDVENADISELERYYKGFGYNEIPKKAPAETGIIELEDLDEEEIKMAAFESWMLDVYNPEWDRKDFDDDEMRDEDNVFSKFYEPPQHPDLPVYEDAQEDLANWKEEIGEDEDDHEYRDHMGQSFNYTVIHDEEFTNEFRGHLVVACSADDEDLEIAEKITLRMDKEFGKQVYVETRLIDYVRMEDNVFEVWLESYEVELIHSKKRATSNTKDWYGPAICDDKQIDYLVDRVGFLISDESRYSYALMMDEELQ